VRKSAMLWSLLSVTLQSIFVSSVKYGVDPNVVW